MDRLQSRQVLFLDFITALSKFAFTATDDTMSCDMSN